MDNETRTLIDAIQVSINELGKEIKDIRKGMDREIRCTCGEDAEKKKRNALV